MDLAGYKLESILPDTISNYKLLTRENKPRAGITQIPWENVKPNWLSYIMVDDIQIAVTEAEKLGARIIVAPAPQLRNGTVAILADPSGAVFGLQKWPL
jgi:predicted enzyme related to lactoylglutathione lyase